VPFGSILLGIHPGVSEESVPGTCVIGLQWGDEAKGKIVDLLTERFEIVVRYQGGANAGHTVVTGGQKFKLSLIPSGILRPGVQCVITGGVALHPPKVLAEMEELRGRGIKLEKNLMISDRAHLVFPWHIEEERVLAERGGSTESIGTTMRGIGPCYRDKADRNLAIRLGDLYRSTIHDQVARIVDYKNTVLGALAAGRPFEPLSAKKICAEYAGYAKQLEQHLGDTTSYLLAAIEADKKILFEGAQGSLLDLDHGTFPYVTSSNSSAVGIASGAGVPPGYLNKIIGVLKAYSTRVGGGPFPTEETGDVGQHIRDRGNEYGTVTGRPRRCGWFDGVAGRYTCRLGGIASLSVMLLDVLSELPEIKICTAYEINGKQTTEFPSHVDDLRQAKPVYETLPGWKRDISSVRKMADLPVEARKYLSRVSELLGRPVEIVSIGPDREQTILG